MPDAALPAAVPGRDRLTGLRLGVSVSGSSDLQRLGLVETHLRLALGEVARAMLVAGARLVYGGHLQPEGYTSFLRDELRTYSRHDRPLLVCLAWSVHRRMRLAELRDAKEDLGLCGEIVCLDVEGRCVDPSSGRGDEPPAADEDPLVTCRALTNLRRHLTSESDARLLMGGRRSGFSGLMPGVLEEAALALEAGQPLFLAGGFGGVAADACSVLGLSSPAWLPERERAARELTDALEALAETARRSGWTPDRNGLDADENARLAASHRPSDVASLVALGLGRLRAAGRLQPAQTNRSTSVTSPSRRSQ